MTPTPRAFLRALITTLLIGLTLLGCSGEGSESSMPANRTAAPSPERRDADGLAVALTAAPADETYEIWSCLTEGTLPLVYTFFRDGTFDGAAANLLLGKELDPANLLDPLLYTWRATSATSLQLDAPDRGMQIDWTGIAIDREGVMTAWSSTRGALWCHRNTVAKTLVENR